MGTERFDQISLGPGLLVGLKDGRTARHASSLIVTHDSVDIICECEACASLCAADASEHYVGPIDHIAWDPELFEGLQALLPVLQALRSLLDAFDALKREIEVDPDETGDDDAI